MAQHVEIFQLALEFVVLADLLAAVAAHRGDRGTGATPNVGVCFRPTPLCERVVQRHPRHQGGDSGHGPRLLGTDDSLHDDFARDERISQLAEPEPLQAEPVRDRIGRGVVPEARDVEHILTAQAAELIEHLHVQVEILADVRGQAGHLDRVAGDQQLTDLGLAVLATEKPDRSLDFGYQVVEHRPHRLEDQFRICRLARVPLEMLGLGEGQLQVLGQLPCEVVAAEWHASLPNAEAVGDDQVGGIRPDRQQHGRRRRGIGTEVILGDPLVHAVISQHVVKCDRCQLNQLNFDTGAVERL